MTAPYPSTSLSGFEELLDTDIPASTVTWETFGTPEYTGGVPGPTDYITLVAEISLAPDRSFSGTGDLARQVHIVPEAARAWLSPSYRTMLDKYKNQAADLPSTYGCRTYTARLRKSGEAVRGFICPHKSTLLLYLTIQEPSD